MNRDLRIGLSLSLLALGAAGAFCFRADPAAVDPAVAAVGPGEPSDDDAPAAADAPRVAAAPPPSPVRLGPPPEPIRPVARRPHAVAPVPAVGPPPPAIAVTLPPSPADLDPPDRNGEPPADVSSSRTYTVGPGDTLSGIAERELGSHRKYHTIFEANRDVLESPDALRVGMELRIPGGVRL